MTRHPSQKDEEIIELVKLLLLECIDIGHDIYFTKYFQS